MIRSTDEIRAGLTLAAAQVQALLDPLDNRILLCHALDISRISLNTYAIKEFTPNTSSFFILWYAVGFVAGIARNI